MFKTIIIFILLGISNIFFFNNLFIYTNDYNDYLKNHLLSNPNPITEIIFSFISGGLFNTLPMILTNKIISMMEDIYILFLYIFLCFPIFILFYIYNNVFIIFLTHLFIYHINNSLIYILNKNTSISKKDKYLGFCIVVPMFLFYFIKDIGHIYNIENKYSYLKFNTIINLVIGFIIKLFLIMYKN